MNQQLARTYLGRAVDYKEIYVRKHFAIFSWWEKIIAKEIGKDLIIETAENYDKIFLNGKELTLNQTQKEI
jgi:hypothetical protein